MNMWLVPCPLARLFHLEQIAFNEASIVLVPFEKTLENINKVRDPSYSCNSINSAVIPAMKRRREYRNNILWVTTSGFCICICCALHSVSILVRS